ncbi:MAG: Lrp/AsnC family transcriptional regulator [Pseudomonadota bacterium]
MIELDAKDRKILNLLQRNNMTPHREIADRVGLSTPAVTRRIGRLRKSGTVRADVSVIDAESVGRPLTIVTQVVADSDQLKSLDQLRRTFGQCPQIQQCFYVTGDADFVLIFSVANISEYNELTRKLFFSTEHVKRFTTFVAMETLKSDLMVVIPEK